MNLYQEIMKQTKEDHSVLVVTTLTDSTHGTQKEWKREMILDQESMASQNPLFQKVWTRGQPVLEGKVFAEPYYPKERLILFGGGHIAIPLCKMASLAGFRVTIVDDRPEFASPARFLEAEQVLCDSFSHSFETLGITRQDYLVIITRGHKHDGECLRQILSRPETIYTGMIGSKRRIATVYQELEDAGYPRERMDRICAPIGLSIGSATPEEISVSILAELIKRKRLDPPKDFAVNRSDLDSEFLESLTHIQPSALVTIMETQGSVPRKAGAKMRVYETGSIQGSIGGGCSESAIMHQAIEIIGTGTWKMVTIDLTPDMAEEEGMVCGGTMKVLIEDMV